MTAPEFPNRYGEMMGIEPQKKPVNVVGIPDDWDELSEAAQLEIAAEIARTLFPGLAKAATGKRSGQAGDTSEP